jgi:SAM-dependent methyltransferase
MKMPIQRLVALVISLLWIIMLRAVHLQHNLFQSQVQSQTSLINDGLQCGSRGSLLIDRCICDPGYGGIQCNIKVHLRSKICQWNNQHQSCWNIPGIGRFRVPSLERQQQAFSCETTFWESTSIPKRNRDQQIAFHFFQDIPKHINNLLEVGAGPYTKTRLILESQPDIHVNHVTLVDPLIQEYFRNPRITTSYPSGKLEVNNSTILTTILAQGGETLSLPLNSFDVIILVNTLEHCANAVTLMNLVYQFLQPNGILVFGESFAMERELGNHDVCHPIQLTREFLLQYLEKFSGIPILPPQIGDSIEDITHSGMKRSIFAIVRRR